MFNTLLKNLTKFASDARFQENATRSLRRYERLIGAIYNDDPYYDSRMTCFLEWFILEEPATGSGNRVLDVYRHERARGSESELAMIDSLDNNIHDIFQVKSARQGKIKVTALFANRSFTIDDQCLSETISKNEIFEGRIVNLDGAWLLTQGVCHHPSAALKFIKTEMKRIRKSGENGAAEFIFRLGSMLTRWRRARNISINEIYK